MKSERWVHYTERKRIDACTRFVFTGVERVWLKRQWVSTILFMIFSTGLACILTNTAGLIKGNGAGSGIESQLSMRLIAHNYGSVSDLNIRSSVAKSCSTLTSQA